MPAPSIQDRYTAALAALRGVGQEHLLNFFDRLDDPSRNRLLRQIEEQDWPALADLVREYVVRAPEMPLPADLEPAPYYPARPTTDLETKYREARRLGEQLIREGKVAPFTVAGGQGTRLGWDGPKGTFPATPITGKPLFQVFAEYIRKVEMKYDVPLTWYIMTSPINDSPTRDFFDAKGHFGLAAERVVFFEQGSVPSFSLDGKALLEAPDRLATNPDGHGGSLRALHRSGAIDRMTAEGVRHISYFQVDNPLVRCIDPLFIGLHALDGSQMSSKMVTKTSASEKVGVFCRSGGRIRVIEYSDLSEHLAGQTDASGRLRFIGGSIAIHVIDVAFVADLNRGRFGMPWHRAVKKVSHIDPATGAAVRPEGPNAVKLETFVFDALPLCGKSVVLETLREDEFAPIKNAEGPDSPATSRQLQSDRACRWLTAAGAKIPRRPDGSFDTLIEVSNLTAIDEADIKSAIERQPARFEANDRITI